MRAIYSISDSADLPPMDADDGYSLHYKDTKGKVAGGLEGYLGNPEFGIVLLDVSSAVNTLMKADPKLMHVKDVVTVKSS